MPRPNAGDLVEPAVQLKRRKISLRKRRPRKPIVERWMIAVTVFFRRNEYIHAFEITFESMEFVGQRRRPRGRVLEEGPALYHDHQQPTAVVGTGQQTKPCVSLTTHWTQLPNR